jgi:hypothetical protein
MEKQSIDKKSIRVLSLGAGVQSSTLAMLAENGEIPRPDFAVFADTQREPEHVLDYLRYLQSRIKSFPIYIATAGDLGEAPQKVPFFLKHADGKVGMGWRQCTADYKIKVVNKEIRRILGYIPRQRMKHHVHVQIGISTEEMERMKLPWEKWKTHEWPLIELGMSRKDCLSYYEKNKLPPPPRSACYFCPYKSNSEWRDLRDSYPNDWAKAVAYDQYLRDNPKTNCKGQQFLHRSCVPLAHVNLGEADNKQLGFLNECEGMCGL